MYDAHTINPYFQADFCKYDARTILPASVGLAQACLNDNRMHPIKCTTYEWKPSHKYNAKTPSVQKQCDQVK